MPDGWPAALHARTAAASPGCIRIAQVRVLARHLVPGTPVAVS